jgi:hypothetical protein
MACHEKAKSRLGSLVTSHLKCALLGTRIFSGDFERELLDLFLPGRDRREPNAQTVVQRAAGGSPRFAARWSCGVSGRTMIGHSKYCLICGLLLDGFGRIMFGELAIDEQLEKARQVKDQILEMAEPILVCRFACNFDRPKRRRPGLGPASVSLFACRREQRGDQFPADLLVPNGLRYCCRNTITHPGPDSRPLTVVALPHRFWPFLVKSPAGSWAFCTPFTGTKAT